MAAYNNTTAHRRPLSHVVVGLNCSGTAIRMAIKGRQLRGDRPSTVTSRPAVVDHDCARRHAVRARPRRVTTGHTAQQTSPTWSARPMGLAEKSRCTTGQSTRVGRGGGVAMVALVRPRDMGRDRRRSATRFSHRRSRATPRVCDAAGGRPGAQIRDSRVAMGFAHKVGLYRTFIVYETVTSTSIRVCAMHGGPNRTGCGTVGLYGQSWSPCLSPARRSGPRQSPSGGVARALRTAGSASRVLTRRRSSASERSGRCTRRRPGSAWRIVAVAGARAGVVIGHLAI